MYSILNKLLLPPTPPLSPITFTKFTSYMVLRPYQKELYRELQQSNTSITITPPRGAGTTDLLIFYTLEQILHRKIKKDIAYISPDRTHIKQVYSDILRQNKMLFKHDDLSKRLDQIRIESCKIYLNPTWGDVVQGIDLIIYDGSTVNEDFITSTPQSRHIIVDYEPKQSIVNRLSNVGFSTTAMM